MVKEYSITIRLKVATYQGDAGVQALAQQISGSIASNFSESSHFILDQQPTVEVKYDPRT